MRILSFDTSNSFASVAVICQNKLLSHNNTDVASQQAEKLLSLIELTLKEANTNLDNLDLISVSCGPGSFTGVRIGLAAALGMQIDSKCKFIALSNFQILAWQKRNHQKNMHVLIEAGKNEYYYQKFNSLLQTLTKPKIISADEILNLADEKDLLIKDSYNNTDVNAVNLALASEYYLTNKLYLPLEAAYIREALRPNL